MNTTAPAALAATTRDLIRRDGFREDAKIDVLDLKDFLAYPVEQHTEYVHIFPDRDRRELRIYRSVQDCGSKRIMTTIEDAFYKTDPGKDVPRRFFISWDSATTLLTALTAYKWDSSRSPAKATLKYTPDAGRPMMEKYDVVEETLNFSYETESGKSNSVAITSLYENVMQSIADY